MLYKFVWLKIFINNNAVEIMAKFDHFSSIWVLRTIYLWMRFKAENDYFAATTDLGSVKKITWGFVEMHQKMAYM